MSFVQIICGVVNLKLYVKRGAIGLLIGSLLEIFVFNFSFWTAGLDWYVMDLSVSRIVTVVLIAVVGTFLFNIQKMPDYNVGNKEE